VGRAYTGALVRAYDLDRAAPLGRNRPGEHLIEVVPMDRDDAPAGGGWQPEDWTREQWLRAIQRQNDPEEPGPHNVAQTHQGPDGRGTVPAPPWLAWQGDETPGRHPPAVPYGAGGAAHGGLRADNSTPWANPEGFNPGHDYNLPNTVRYMGPHRTRGTLRPAPEPYIETGQASSPAAGLGRGTSPFDPAAAVTRFGVAVPTLRRVLRPYGDGDYVDADESPQTSLDAPESIGSGWVL
jgi:hypothetical protein